MVKPRVGVFLLVVALAVSAAGAIYFVLERNSERVRRIWAEDQLEKIRKTKLDLEQERDELIQAKSGLEEQITGLNEEAKNLADQLAQEKRARQALTTQLAQTRQATETFQKQLETERQEKQGLTEELAKAKESYQALANELTTLRQAKEALEKRVKEMLAARAKEAERIVVTPPPDFIPPPIGGGIGSSGANLPRPVADKSGGEVAPPRVQAVGSVAGSSLEGKVLVVNREFNFIVVSLGSKDGVRAGSRFSVVREGEPIGTVEVERLYENMAAANVLPEATRKEILEGDTVRLLS